MSLQLTQESSNGNLEELVPNEALLTPEKKEAIRGIVSHELGHAVAAWAQGIPLTRLVFSVENGKQKGGTTFYSFENVTPRIHGVCLAAGLAGELTLLGEDYVRASGFRGLRSDSTWLNRLGYTSQEQKADLLREALGLLNTNVEVYKKWALEIQEQMETAVKNGQDKIEITRELMEKMGILDYYKPQNLQ